MKGYIVLNGAKLEQSHEKNNYVSCLTEQLLENFQRYAELLKFHFFTVVSFLMQTEDIISKILVMSFF